MPVVDRMQQPGQPAPQTGGPIQQAVDPMQQTPPAGAAPPPAGGEADDGAIEAFLDQAYLILYKDGQANQKILSALRGGGADPAAGGSTPPMDPAAGAGAIPPGAGADPAATPPMDPAAAPPMDPAAAGGAPPADPAVAPAGNGAAMDPKQPPTALANAAVMVSARVAHAGKSSGQPIDGPRTVLPATLALVADIAGMAEKEGIYEYSDDEMNTALMQAMERLYGATQELGLWTKEEFDQGMREMMAANKSGQLDEMVRIMEEEEQSGAPSSMGMAAVEARGAPPPAQGAV